MCRSAVRSAAFQAEAFSISAVGLEQEKNKYKKSIIHVIVLLNTLLKIDTFMGGEHGGVLRHQLKMRDQRRLTYQRLI